MESGTTRLAIATYKVTYQHNKNERLSTVDVCDTTLDNELTERSERFRLCKRGAVENAIIFVK
jgi:hypothetical protein